ncbi:MAG TPA: glycosyltransferase family 4 protein, partial [Bryobacteraceae bacterium]|nr:glycosyltransferase family 4 protein [Bryobacteraceae bacterium]
MTISTDESSKTIHVFASDFLPFPGCPRTAGGNRSMQIISALRRAGHKVTYSMPLVSDMAKKNVSKIEPPLTAEEIWLCDNFFDPDFVLNRVQPDVAIYCNINCFRTVRRFSKDIVHILDLYGPLQFEGLLLDTNDPAAAMHDGPGLERRCREMVDKIRDIDYLVTVSERQKYFWSAYCTLAGFSFQELNVLVCPTSFDVPAKPRNTASNLTVVYSGGFYPWQNPDRSLRAAATLLDEIPGAVLHIYGGPHPGLPNEPEVRQMLAELQQHKCVQYHGYRPVEELLSTLSTAWCALELMEQNLERELAITGRTVEFLSTGTPVIYNNYATISKLIEGYRAGWTLSPEDPFAMRSVFRELVEGGPARVEELSGNARRLAAIEFSESRATAALVDLCSRPVAKRSGTKATGSKAKSAGASRSIGRVLAISPDANALVELRISNPLRGMQRQGLIDGMVITNPSCESLRNDHSSYDAVIVQRAVPRYIYHTLANLAIDFVQDIDDNTLARAAYRRGIPPEIEILDGLHHCKVLSTPNPRLVRGLEKYSGIPLAHKAFITP